MKIIRHDPNANDEENCDPNAMIVSPQRTEQLITGRLNLYCNLVDILIHALCAVIIHLSRTVLPQYRYMIYFAPSVVPLLSEALQPFPFATAPDSM
jgi:hypothetical protein